MNNPKYELLKWSYYGTQGTNIKTSWRVVQRNELGEIVQVLRSATLKRDAIRTLNKLNETIKQK
jgi:hypothetical protein